MSRLNSAKWILIVACIVGVAGHGVAFARGGGGHGGGGHGGHGGGHHGGGHHSWGGHHHGGGHYYRGGGYGGYGGYYGGYGLGYGWGGYGNYGYGNYGYGSNYYTQPVYIQPTYVNPAYPVVIQASQVQTAGGDIILFSPAETGKDIQYSLNGSPFIMKPGGVQRFANDRTWTIDINTGNGQNLRYTLVPNNYKFKPTENGMGLFSTMDQPGGSTITPANASSTPSSSTTPAAAPTPAPGT